MKPIIRRCRRNIPGVAAAAALLGLGGRFPVFAVPPAPPPRAEEATITIHVNQSLGPVNRLIWGHNVEAADTFGIFGDKHYLSIPQTGEGLWNPVQKAPVPAMVESSKAIGTRLLRYPGGCLVHNFHWKNTIGPVKERPNFTFGLDEYLTYCRAVNAVPLIIVSDYVDTPQDAADLVEYLNAPADALHPWARKRAANGHLAPYHVRYFELGNETDHGNHLLQPPRKFSAADYVAYFSERAAKMKATDPSVQLGALMGTGTGPFDPWNGAVLAGLQNKADFIIVHTYVLDISSDAEADVLGGDRLMRACLASDSFLEQRLAQYHAQVRKYAGRDFPLAVTEYNASFVQEKPVPYRFSYGAALFAADYVRVLLQPKSNVLMANYWEFANGYWGMVRSGSAGSPDKNAPAYFLFRLWGQHFGGDTLVPVDVAGPRVSFEGLWRRSGKLAVPPMRGDRFVPAAPLTGQNLLTHADKTLQAPPQSGTSGDAYPDLVPSVPVQGGTDYAVSFEGRRTTKASFPAGTSRGIGVVDARGWNVTHSGIGIEGMEKTGEWKRFSGTLHTLPDAQAVSVTWRLMGGGKQVTGQEGGVEVRNITMTAVRPETLPAYPALTAVVSRSRDGKKFYLIVFNKSVSQNLAASLVLPGFKTKTVRVWEVNGSSLETTNQNEEKVREVKTGASLPVPVSANTPLRYVFPAHSMTALEIE